MPRRNRPRKARHTRQAARRARPEGSGAVPRPGPHRVEVRHGVAWHVQPMSAERAIKPYTCPGCARPIEPGVAHLVVWRSGGVLGDAADLAARRHWHTACWRVS